MTRFTFAAEMLGVRPGRGASFSKPAIPTARNRFRQRAAFCAVIPNSPATSLSCFPAAASNTIRARSTRRTDRDRARAHCSNASCCSGVRSIGGATRIGEPLYCRDVVPRIIITIYDALVAAAGVGATRSSSIILLRYIETPLMIPYGRDMVAYGGEVARRSYGLVWRRDSRVFGARH